MRCFKQHDGSRFSGEGSQPLRAGFAFAREKAFKHEPAGVQPTQGQGSRDSRRAGDDADCDARGVCGRYKRPGRVGNPRRACIGCYGDKLTLLGRRDQFAHNLLLSVLVETNQLRRLNSRKLQQLACPAGVFASDDVGRRQSLNRSGREVAEVANRRSNQHDGTSCRHCDLTSTRSPAFKFHLAKLPAAASRTRRDRNLGSPIRQGFIALTDNTRPLRST